MPVNIMRLIIVRIFIYSAGILFLATAIAKLISASGSARILQTPDPVFSISFRNVFWIVGTLEFIVALVCFFSRRMGLQAGLVVWLASSFLAYRLNLLWIGWHRPCPCMGNLTDALHIAPQTADTAMKIVLGYLLVGSYATLFWLWKEKRNARFVAPSSAEVT